MEGTEEISALPQAPTAPPWVTKEFIQEALRKEERNNEITVQNLSVGYEHRRDRGYVSLIFRVEAAIQKGTLIGRRSVVVKVAPDLATQEDETNELSVFQTESLVLDEVMSEIHDLLRSVEGDTFRPLTAKCFSCGKQPTDFIVLEDLVGSGFRLVEASKPLDLEHCSLVIRSYGRLHAASAFLLKQQPKYAETFARDAFTDDISDHLFELWSRDMFRAAADDMMKCPVCVKYADKYLQISEKAMGMVVSTMKAKQRDTKLRVLTHGDGWKNNMMFKYLQESPAEIRFVDFQATSVNSPVRDLVYFLYSNASEEVHLQHFDLLVAEYHSTLVSTLRALGMDDAAQEYPLEQLKKDMDDYLVVGMLFTMMSSFVLKSKGADRAANGFGHDNYATTHTNCTAHNMLTLKYLSPIFEANGIL